MVLKQLTENSFDIRSIKAIELDFIIQGLQLLQDNNNSIQTKSIKDQQKIYIDALSEETTDPEEKKKIRETILSQWEIIKEAMQQITFSIQKTLTEIRTIK